MEVSAYSMTTSKLVLAYGRAVIQATSAISADTISADEFTPVDRFPINKVWEQQYLASVLDSRMRGLRPPIPEGTIVRVKLPTGELAQNDSTVKWAYRSEKGVWLYQLEGDEGTYSHESLRVIWDFASLMRTLRRRLG